MIMPSLSRFSVKKCCSLRRALLKDHRNLPKVSSSEFEVSSRVLLEEQPVRFPGLQGPSARASLHSPSTRNFRFSLLRFLFLNKNINKCSTW